MAAKMYFIAIVAPPGVNEKVLQWKHYMREHYGCVAALKSPAHITLIPPFWMNEEMEHDLKNDVQAFSSGQPSFSLRLSNFDSFKPKVIFIAVEKSNELKELHTSLENFLIAKNIYPVKKEMRPFHPHMTLANRDLRKKDFPEAFAHFQKMQYRQEFPVTDLSILKHDGMAWQVAASLPFNC